MELYTLGNLLNTILKEQRELRNIKNTGGFFVIDDEMKKLSFGGGMLYTCTLKYYINNNDNFKLFEVAISKTNTKTEEELITSLKQEVYEEVVKRFIHKLINCDDYFKVILNNDLNKLKDYGI